MSCDSPHLITLSEHKRGISSLVILVTRAVETLTDNHVNHLAAGGLLTDRALKSPANSEIEHQVRGTPIPFLSAKWACGLYCRVQLDSGENSPRPLVELLVYLLRKRLDWIAAINSSAV